MTQVLVNNLDILQNNISVINTDNNSGTLMQNSNDVGIDNSLIENFDKILDKTLQISDINTEQLIAEEAGDMSIVNTPDLNEILVQALQEANMEKSLDLTLEKDIATTISSIKQSANPNNETTLEITDADVNLELLKSDNNIDTEKNKEDNSSEKQEDTPVIFEQVLTFINNNEIKNTNINNQSDNFNMKEQKYENVAQQTFSTKDLEETKTFNKTLDNTFDKDLVDKLNIESIVSDNDSATYDSNTNNQSPEEFGVKVMLNHSSEKVNVDFTKTLNIENSKTVNTSPEKIIEQITKHLDSLKSNSGVKIVLNPESLGKINLQIVNTKDGLSAQFTVTTNEARDLLMKGLDGLKESLLTHGVGIDNISVKVNEAEESRYNSDWTEQQENSNNNHREQQKQNKEEKEKGLFEKTIAKNLKNKNGNV